MKKGFTIIELLLVIAIIGVIAGVIIVAMAPARGKARDAQRKQDLATIGQFIYGNGCYAPDAGAGDYDIQEIAAELATKNPQYANYTNFLPRDPLKGTSTASFYHYIEDGAGHCGIYTNLENEGEPVTLPNTSPTAGVSGVWAGPVGWNGTTKYYQVGK